MLHDVRPKQHRHDLDEDRRRLIRGLALGAVALSVPGVFANELVRTPRQTEGPFYPDKLPLDTDNDLLIINDGITPAVGAVTWLGGRILDARGEPVRNALVEIWQCDSHGVYLHSGSANGAKRDGHFQGFGRFLTGSKGEYGFRTIKPVPYPGRTPHIHMAVKIKGHETFTTQCYVKGEPQNERDSILMAIRDETARNALIVPFSPLSGSRVGELAATFDVVLGFTPSA
jgi:protocatechuate 3,4-dioxygenase, beta subunit